MIQQLLSSFKSYPEKYCKLSKTSQENNYLLENTNYIYANRMLLIITIGWVIIQMISYPPIYQRPAELIHPTHYFGQLFMQTLPSEYFFKAAGSITIFLILINLFYKNSFLMRIVITFALLWLNLPYYSFGFQCHPGHLLLLSHLFGIFIPVNKINAFKKDKDINSSIQWFYFGLLFTYFLSGFWKIIGVFYKIIFKQGELHWLSKDAALYNAIVSYRQIDYPLNKLEQLFSISLFWQLGFIFICYVLTCSTFSAFRHPIKVWAGLSLILFHMINMIVFDITFITAQFVLASLFFPYEIIFNSVYQDFKFVIKQNFKGNKSQAYYEREYSNGDKDIFYGYYAYREKINDNNKLLGSLLYLPFGDILIISVWKIGTLKLSKTSSPQNI